MKAVFSLVVGVLIFSACGLKAEEQAIVPAKPMPDTTLVGKTQGGPTPRSGFNFDLLARLAIQDRGRIKPLDTFALESVQTITGKSSWKGMSPIEVIFSWLVAYDREWEDEAFIRVDYGPLKKALGLPEGQRYFTPEALRTNAPFQKLIRDIIAKDRRRERLDELEKRATAVQNQRGLLEAIVTGQALNIMPNPAGIEQNWFSLAQIADPGNSLPYTAAQKIKVGQAIKGLLDGYVAPGGLATKLWNDSVFELSELVHTELAPGQYPSLGSSNVRFITITFGRSAGRGFSTRSLSSVCSFITLGRAASPVF